MQSHLLLHIAFATLAGIDTVARNTRTEAEMTAPIAYRRSGANRNDE